jgi:D-alanyl-D-alanine carboxypeptidase
MRVRRLTLIPLAACVAVLVASCSSAPAPAPSPLNTIDPAQFQAAAGTVAKQLMVPGALVLLRTPQGTFTAEYGTTELGTQTPPEPSTHFRIASNTKTMTAALIVLLAQDGKLAFDDNVSAYVPGVPNGENITIAELLKMRSGLYGYTNAPEFSKALDADLAKSWTPQEVLRIAYAHPPEFPPNESYDYSNTNYALLGLVAEKVGGRPLRQQLAERLFEPLGMQQTSLPAIDDTSMPAPYSHGYMYGGSAFAMVDDPYPADMQAAAKAGTLKPIDYTHQNSSYATGAGGAISTADDLATWMQALLSGKVFNADYQQQWLNSPQAEDPDQPDGQKYGYGISYQRFGPNAAMYYHGGELPGFNSFMGHDPENDVTLVIWTNQTLSPDGRTTAQGMLPTMLDEIYAGLNLTG